MGSKVNSRQFFNLTVLRVYLFCCQLVETNNLLRNGRPTKHISSITAGIGNRCYPSLLIFRTWLRISSPLSGNRPIEGRALISQHCDLLRSTLLGLAIILICIPDSVLLTTSLVVQFRSGIPRLILALLFPVNGRLSCWVPALHFSFETLWFQLCCLRRRFTSHVLGRSAARHVVLRASSMPRF